MIVLNLPSLATSINIKAMLRVIRRGESWNDDAHPGSEYDERAYRVRYGGWKDGHFLAPEFFGSFDDHPRLFEPIPDGRKSSAAGAFQFTATTWDDVCARYAGVGPRFTPMQQEYAAICLMHDVGALDEVIDGNIAAALPKLARHWASLPSSPLDDGGRKLSLAVCYDVFRHWQRVYGNQQPEPAEADREVPAEIEDRSRPARPEDVERITGVAPEPVAAPPQEEEMAAPLLFVVPLLQSLFEAFSPLVRAKVTKALDKQGVDAASSAQVADNLMGIVKNVAASAGVPMGESAPAAIDPVIAVATVKQSPALIAQAESAINDYVDKMAPLLDHIDRLEHGAWTASEESARLAAARAQGEPDGGQDGVLTWAILIIAGTVLAVLGIALGVLIYYNRPYGEILALFAAGVGSVWAKFGTRYDYRYGSSRSSQAKDFAINQLSRK